MKILGCILIVICSGGIGFSYINAMQKRVEELEWFLHLIEAIREELSYSMASVEDIILKISVRKELMHVPILGVYKNIEYNSLRFPNRWELATNSFEWAVNADELEMIMSLSDIFGAYDQQNQLNALSVLGHRTEAKIVEAKDYRNKHAKLYPTLGILSGIGICIFMI